MEDLQQDRLKRLVGDTTWLTTQGWLADQLDNGSSSTFFTYGGKHFIMRNIGKFKQISLLVALLLLVGAAFLVGSVSGGHSAALAQTPPTSTAPVATGTPTVTGTEAVGQETSDGAAEPKSAETDSAASQAALQAAAKITVEQAKTAALAKVPGTVVSASLEDENGKAVYQVVVTPTAGGANQEIKVDAANGTVLVAAAGDNQDSQQGGSDTETAGSESNN